MASVEFNISNAADQLFSCTLNGKRCSIRLRFNTSMNRWTINMAIDDLMVLHGRKVVTGVDLLRAYDFDIGLMWCTSETNLTYEPGRKELVSGLVKLFHCLEEDIINVDAIFAESQTGVQGEVINNQDQSSWAEPARLKSGVQHRKNYFFDSE